jgi:hypothetical protein
MLSATGPRIGDSYGSRCFSSFLPLSLTFSDSLARRRGRPEVLSTWTPRRRLKNIDGDVVLLFELQFNVPESVSFIGNIDWQGVH